MAGVANPFVVEVTSAGLTTSITTYASGDQLGTEITCAPSGAAASAFFVVDSITLIDYSKVLGAVDLRLFNAATTPAADNAAYAWSDADSNKLIPGGVVNLGAPVADANNSVVAIPNEWIKGRLDGSAQFYLDLITRSANAVFGAVGDIHVKLGGFWFS